MQDSWQDKRPIGRFEVDAEQTELADPLAWTPPRFLRRHAQRVQQRRRIRRTIWCLAAGLFLYAFIFSHGGLVTILRSHLEVRQLEARVADLERCEDRLLDQIERRRSHAPTIERIAREQYGMIRPGERVFRILEVSEEQARRMEERKRSEAWTKGKENGPPEGGPEREIP